MKTAGLLGLAAMSMAAMASVPHEIIADRAFNTPSEPRLRHARKVHARRYDHLVGAWLDPDFSFRLAAQRNAQMELERKLEKARKLEEGRARVAAGCHRTHRVGQKWVIEGDRAIVTAWG